MPQIFMQWKKFVVGIFSSEKNGTMTWDRDWADWKKTDTNVAFSTLLFQFLK